MMISVGKRLGGGGNSISGDRAVRWTKRCCGGEHPHFSLLSLSSSDVTTFLGQHSHMPVLHIRLPRTTKCTHTGHQSSSRRKRGGKNMGQCVSFWGAFSEVAFCLLALTNTLRKPQDCSVCVMVKKKKMKPTPNPLPALPFQWRQLWSCERDNTQRNSSLKGTIHVVFTSADFLN